MGYLYDTATGAITNGSSPTVVTFSAGATTVTGGSSQAAFNGVDSSYKLFFIFNQATDTVVPCQYSVSAGRVTVTQLTPYSYSLPTGAIQYNGMINPVAHLLFGIGKASMNTTNAVIGALSYSNSGAITPTQQQTIALGSNSTNGDSPLVFAVVN
jgi:hypothetical protein